MSDAAFGLAAAGQAAFDYSSPHTSNNINSIEAAAIKCGISDSHWPVSGRGGETRLISTYRGKHLPHEQTVYENIGGNDNPNSRHRLGPIRIKCSLSRAGLRGCLTSNDSITRDRTKCMELQRYGGFIVFG